MPSDKSKNKRCCLPPEQFVTLTTTLAIALSQGMTTAEIDSLSNFFETLSIQLAAISAQKSFCQGDEPTLIA